MSLPLARRRGPGGSFFYGWWIVIAAIAIQSVSAGLFSQAYGAYIVLLRDDFGWSKTSLSLGYSWTQAQQGLLGPIQGWATDRVGPRNMVRAGLFVLAAGFLLLSRVESYPLFLLAVTVMGLGSMLCGFLSLTTAVVNWFDRRRATALGLNNLGVAFAGAIVPLTVLALGTLGWRTTAMLSAAVVVVVGLPIAQLLHHRPADLGLMMDGDTPDAVESEPRHAGSRRRDSANDFTLREAMRTRQFWFLSLGHGSALLIVSAVGVHLVPHLHSGLGYSLGAASAFITLMTLLQGAGNVAGGALSDRFNKRAIAVVCMATHAVALVIVAYAGHLAVVALGVCLHGLAWGIRGPIMAALRADYYGARAFGAIMGTSMAVVMIGSTGGPLLAGYLSDRTGNYELGFTVLSVLATLGSVFFVLATQPEPPARIRQLRRDMPATAAAAAASVAE
jgi:sugar phosphate permease